MTQRSLLSGSFAYIDNSYKARMESLLLPWKPFHQSAGVCLRFNYLMPTKSKPSLKVFLRNTKRKMLVLRWQLVGFHGKEWSAAQVAWAGAAGVQVREHFLFQVSFKALDVNSLRINVIETLYGSHFLFLWDTFWSFFVFCRLSLRVRVFLMTRWM